MTKRIQHITTILLLLLMVCSGKAWGQWDGTTYTQPSGAGTSVDDPFIIDSAAKLAWLGQQMKNNLTENGKTYGGKYWKITEDIDLGGNNGADWKNAIGTTDYIFHGYVDGGNHTISNIKISASLAGKCYGLFPKIVGASASDRAEVKDLTLNNVNITSTATLSGTTYIGGFAGALQWATVTNVHILGGTISSSDNMTGTVYIGNMGGSTGDLTKEDPTKDNVDFIDCSTSNVTIELNGNVSGSGTYVSNFLGFSFQQTKLSNCHVTNSTIHSTTGGKITNEQSLCMGGLIGAVNNLNATENTGDIDNCSVTDQTIDVASYGPATANNYYLNMFAVGGVIGRLWTPFKLPTNLYFSGKINSPNSAVAPIVGVFMAIRKADTYISKDYSGDSNNNVKNSTAPSTWFYGDYKIGISDVLKSSTMQLNIDRDAVGADGYVTVGNVSGWKGNNHGGNLASKTIMWFTSSGGTSQTSTSEAQNIYPAFYSVNSATYPSYYMYFMQGVNRGRYGKYTLQLKDWPAGSLVKVAGDEAGDVSYNTDGDEVSVRSERSVSDVTVSPADYNGFTSHVSVDNLAMTITAYYTKQYNLQLVGAPSSGVSVTIDHDYNNGTFTSGTYTAEGTVEVTPSFTASDVTVAPVSGYTISTEVDDANSTITVTYALTSYSITVNQPTGGTISASKTTAHAGEEITLTATADNQKMLSKWIVSDGTNEISVTDNKFTMPSNDVTVSAIFVDGFSGNQIVIQSVSDNTKYLASPHANSAVSMSNQFEATVFELVQKSGYYYLKENATETDWWLGQPNSTSSGVNMVAETVKNNGYSGLFSFTKDNNIYKIQDKASSGSKYYLTLSGNTAVGNSSGSTDASKWYIHVVTPYTVSITGATGTVTYNGSNLYGADKTQSTGGTYFFEGEPVKAQFIGNTTVANKAGKVTIDNENHEIKVEFIDAYSYTMTLVDLPSGSTVAVAGDIDNATYTESGTVITNKGTLTESDITLTPATNASGFSKRVVIDNSARTIKAGYAQAYTLTFVDAPSGATATILHDFDGGSHNANGTIYLTQTITDADITASASGYFITKAIDNTTHTITLTYDNGAMGITSLSQITNLSGNYFAKPGFTATGTPVGTQADPFTGTFDGRFVTISGTTSALFGYVDGGTIKNVTLDNVTISGGTNVGAIANEASGNARIYNCQVLASGSKDFIANRDNEDKPFLSSSSVSGTGAVGGIVGLISGNARVINCVSYADVSGGTYGAGIVGKYEGTWVQVQDKGEIVTPNGNFVVNCLMLGNVTSGTKQSPVVGGNAITTGISTYSYFRYPSMPNIASMTQNGALSVETDMWLKRYEFFRSVLNTHRDLAAVYCFNDGTKKSEMAKWTINESVSPWPILKAHDENTKKTLSRTIPSTTADYAGKQLTEMGNGGNLSVSIRINGRSYSSTLPITDMDTLHYDYTWGKVVLPFANEFDGWSRDYDYVCIGWEITSVDTPGKNEYSDYNFADRDCTDKDLYSVSGYIFAQGGQYIVPYGVKSISIKAHFAKAYYLADEYYDMDLSGITLSGSSQSGSAKGNAGKRSDTYHDKTVYHTIADAWTAMAANGNKYTPHDQAIVLVGNYHYTSNVSGDHATKGCTLMSVDEDNDQEPDFSWQYSLVGNDSYGKDWPSVRWDFVPMLGAGVFQICGAYTGGIVTPYTLGWWEMTETSLVRTYEYEIYDTKRANNDNGKGNNAWILNGGYHQALIRCKGGTYTKLSYIKLGGNVYIKDLHPGNHSAQNGTWTLRPINITGGEIKNCYMTGLKASNTRIITSNSSQPNNMRFYCAGGKLHKYLSCYMEGPVKDATMRIDHAIIYKFFGGGTSPVSPITGNIDIQIDNSLVNMFCGGPEFGDMATDKQVKVKATGTTFGEYFGAGYGGTSLTLRKFKENSGSFAPSSINGYYKSIDPANNTGELHGPVALTYQADGGGTCVDFEYEMLMNARGQVCERCFVHRAALSLATTKNVSSTIENCIILGNFYGGGCQGKVDGTITSSLTNCDIRGSVFGGGYKADIPTISVMDPNESSMPDANYSRFNSKYGFYTSITYPATTPYKWMSGTTDGTVDQTNHTITTTTDMTQMGVVTGAIDLTITNGKVGGSVFGGGNESLSKNNTSVTILGSAEVGGNVYGGGNAAEVQGTTKVQIGDECIVTPAP